jgi:hypothetical protein
MTTGVLDRVPLEDIGSQAREVKPGRTILTLIAGALFGLGWVTARVFAVLWLGVAWSFIAVREGWRASHGPSRAMQMTRLKAQNEELQARISRFEGV